MSARKPPNRPPDFLYAEGERQASVWILGRRIPRPNEYHLQVKSGGETLSSRRFNDMNEVIDAIPEWARRHILAQWLGLVPRGSREP